MNAFVTVWVRWSQALERYARGPIILFFTVMSALFGLVVLPRGGAQLKSTSGGVGPIDTLFFYTPDRVYDMIAAYGEAGRAMYRTSALTADLIYPIAYSLFLGLAITWCFGRLPAGWRWGQRLNVLPFGAALFDVLENVSVAIMLSVHPARPALLAWMATAFTMTKWGLVGVSVGTLAIGCIFLGTNEVWRKLKF